MGAISSRVDTVAGAVGTDPAVKLVRAERIVVLACAGAAFAAQWPYCALRLWIATEGWHTLRQLLHDALASRHNIMLNS